MSEESSSRHEPKTLGRPTRNPEDNNDTGQPTRPLSGSSGRLGWYEQQRSDVAGPSRQRPHSRASVQTAQTAYRVVPEDDYSLGAPPSSTIGTPSVERNVNLPQQTSGARAPGPGMPRSNDHQRDDRSRQRSSDQALNEVSGPAPVQQETFDGQWRRDEHIEDEDDHSQFASGLYPPSALGEGRYGSSRGTERSSSGALNEVSGPAPVARGHGNSGLVREEHFEDDDTSDQSALPPPPFTKKQPSSDPESASNRPSNLATHIYTYSYLIFFSFLGTLARLGVQWLTFYPGTPLVTPVTWANIGGSMFMGFLSEDRKVFRDEWGIFEDNAKLDKKLEEEKADEEAAKKAHAKVKKTIPLYIGLATGFCGSFTSFSSFQRDVFLALSNDLPTPDNHPYSGTSAPSFTSTVHRNGGYSFMALLGVIIYTVGLSLAALFVGAHIAIAVDPWTPTLPFRFMRNILDRAMVVLALGCWLGAVFLAIWPPDRPGGPSSRGSWANEVWRGEVLFALIFAPLGCLLRYYASIKLNGISASFPLGTFAVNIFGCAVEAMCYDIQHVPLLSVGSLVGGGRVGCQVLQGVMDGFCGCLTTVSTWVAELQGLRRRHAYFYGLVSLGVGLGIMVIIMGSVRWTVGWSETACVTMRTSM